MYKPKEERVSDGQYRSVVGHILKHGILVKNTPQGIGALTCFGDLPPMVFDPRNGVPLLTERKLGIRNPIAEITGFINGARTIEQLESFGISGEAYWAPYRGKGTKFGMAPNDLGPGSYGAAFHDFEIPRPWWQFWKPSTLNQFKRLIEHLKKYPDLRTHHITPWKPYYTGVGPERKVIVAPCHGWQFYRVMNGRLYLTMVQRSADVPLGVPSNMIQYMALLLAICQVTGYEPGYFSHILIDAHIYENQIDAMRELVGREPLPLPVLHLDPEVKDLFEFRHHHFTLSEYEPHPAMKIPYTP